MKLLAFTIYDEKAEAFSPPFFTNAIGIASRQFSELVNNADTMIHKHPADFTLYHVGYFDNHTAKFDPNATPALIGKATDYIEKPAIPAPTACHIKGIETIDHA